MTATATKPAPKYATALEILQAVTSKKITKEEGEKLMATFVPAGSAKSAGVSLKVSEKGAVSVYGMRRFPITFYKSEWESLLGMGEQIREFIAEHDGELKEKGE